MTELMSKTCSSLLNTPFKNFRRPSITQGTISSKCKDVRLKEPVSSLLRQKSMIVSLKTRHKSSMRTVLPQKSVDSGCSSEHAMKKTVSNTDLTKNDCESDALEVKEESLDSKDEIKSLSEEFQEKVESITFNQECSSVLPLPSCSPSSLFNFSLSSSIDGSELGTSYLKPQMSPIDQVREAIMKALVLTNVSYTNQVQSLEDSMQNLRFSQFFDDVPKRHSTKCLKKIKKCKYLMLQQQELLEQLENIGIENNTPTKKVDNDALRWIKIAKNNILNRIGNYITYLSSSLIRSRK